MQDLPKAVVVAEFEALALSLVNLLLSNKCEVIVVANDGKSWKKEFGKKIEITNASFLEKSKTREVRYLVYVEELTGEKTGKDSFVQVLNLTKEIKAKLLVILPYINSKREKIARKEALTKKYCKDWDVEAGVFYVGEVIGPEMKFLKEGLAGGIISDALDGSLVKVPKRPVSLDIASAKDAADYLVKSLFSFGEGYKKAALVYAGVDTNDFAETLKEIRPDVVLTPAVIDFSKDKVSANEIFIKGNLKEALKETLEWFSDKRQPNNEKSKKTFTKKEVAKRSSSTFAKTLTLFSLLIVVLVFFIPMYFLAISGASLLLSKNYIASGDLEKASKFLIITKKTAGFAGRELVRYSQIPILGQFFEPGVVIADLLERGSTMGSRAVTLVDYSSGLLEKILGDRPYVVSSETEKISLEIDSFYKDVSFFYGEIANLSGVRRRILSSFSGADSGDEVREKILLAKKLVDELPEILGEEERKKYLLLFQNNMELRPAGGFIGSFALATFEKGRLIDFSVNDVYSADGQLKGHVEPPLPIKEHLGEAGWYLRDSNWDPDFPSSAEAAEWFLEKEMDETVDGVIGVDMETIKEILKATGPVYLADYDQKIDYKNLYERTQYEVEKDFFPGSRKKTNYLTSLTRELFLNISNKKLSEYGKIGGSVFRSLEQRHIQIFFKNNKVFRIVSDLDWGGEVKTPSCSNNCFYDWLGLAEANLGVNKANYFIERSHSLIVSFDGSKVARFLSVSLANKASPVLGQLAKYKAYIRLLVPQESEIEKVELVTGRQKEELKFDIEDIASRREVGVLVNVEAGQAKTLNFSWNQNSLLNFDKPGEYRFYWRKQAGTLADGAVMRFYFPREAEIYARPTFSLTETASFGYNTTLAKDLVSTISW